MISNDKKAIDLQGKIVIVPIETPTKVINGEHYLLNADDLSEIAEKEAAYLASKPTRQNAEIIEKRKLAYGTAEQQIEYAIENGWEALRFRNLSIKQAHPKIKEV